MSVAATNETSLCAQTDKYGSSRPKQTKKQVLATDWAAWAAPAPPKMLNSFFFSLSLSLFLESGGEVMIMHLPCPAPVLLPACGSALERFWLGRGKGGSWRKEGTTAITLLRFSSQPASHLYGNIGGGHRPARVITTQRLSSLPSLPTPSYLPCLCMHNHFLSLSAPAPAPVAWNLDTERDRCPVRQMLKTKTYDWHRNNFYPVHIIILQSPPQFPLESCLASGNDSRACSTRYSHYYVVWAAIEGSKPCWVGHTKVELVNDNWCGSPGYSYF